VNPIPIKRIYLSTLFFVMVFAGMAISARYMENLGRGVVAVRTSSSEVYVGWRMLGTEWGKNIGFHIYRDGVRITSSPITSSTNYIDTTTVNGVYNVSPVIDGVEGIASSPAVSVWSTNYLTVPLSKTGRRYHTGRGYLLIQPQ
jgi:rhamnogalacturonan endolyase